VSRAESRGLAVERDEARQELHDQVVAFAEGDRGERAAAAAIERGVSLWRAAQGPLNGDGIVIDRQDAGIVLALGSALTHAGREREALGLYSELEIFSPLFDPFVNVTPDVISSLCLHVTDVFVTAVRSDGWSEPALYEEYRQVRRAVFGAAPGDLHITTDFFVAFAKIFWRAFRIDPATNMGDLFAALAYFHHLGGSAPGAVPEMVREYFGLIHPTTMDSRRPHPVALLARGESERSVVDPGPFGRATLIARAQMATAVDAGTTAAAAADLCVALIWQFGVTADKDYLDEAVMHGTLAIKALSQHDARRPKVVGAMAMAAAFGSYYEPFEAANLESALTSARRLLARLPTVDEARLAVLSGYAMAAGRAHELYGWRDDLDLVIGEYLRLARSEETNARIRSDLWLSAALNARWRYDTSNSREDLNRALHVYVAALDDVEREEKGEVLSGYARLRHELYGFTADYVDLSEAVSAMRESLRSDRIGNRSKDEDAVFLAVLLIERYNLLRYPHDCQEAVRLLEPLAAADGVDDEELALRLANLGAALLAASSHQRDEVESATLDRAVELTRRALDLSGQRGRQRLRWLLNLGRMLMRRASGAAPESDLSAAIEACSEAMECAEEDDEARGQVLDLLAIVYHRNYEITGQLGDIDLAVDCGRSALALVGKDAKARASRQLALGGSLMARFTAAGDPADRSLAVELWASIARGAASPAYYRCEAGRLWGQEAAAYGNFSLACAAFSIAVEQMPLLAWRGLDPFDRQEQLAKLYSLPTSAAACALRAGRPSRAVELLELGRGIFWNQEDDLLADLNAVERVAPEIADRLRKVGESLRLYDRAIYQARAAETLTQHMRSISFLLEAANGGAVGHIEDQKLNLVLERERLIERVRGLPGLADFGRQPTLKELLSVTAGRIIVLLNISYLGSEAIVLTEDGFDVVPLPLATPRECGERGHSWMLALLRAEFDTESPDVRSAFREVADEVLDWLWTAVTEPVLNHLQHLRPPVGNNPWPHVWWMPTHLLTALPLHAARPRRPAGSGARPPDDSVLDRVVSSYTPTLTALWRTGKRPRQGAAPKMLIVAVTERPGLPRLQFARGEAAAVQRSCRGMAVTPLLDSQATVSNVVALLKESSWLHIACHNRPALDGLHKGALVLFDDVIRVPDLIAEKIDGAEFAYLSTCHSADGVLQHTNEALNLAAALRLVGYRHVIATLWSAGDRSAARVAESVYTALRTPEGMDSSRAAEALHHAVRHERALAPDAPLGWAPYIHIGP